MEVFSILLLDSQHQLLGYHELFQGTIDSTSIYPREVVKLALQKNAAAVIAAHNHPSGMLKPSVSDKQLTQKLKLASESLDIKVLDHIILTEKDYFSFADESLL